MPVRNSPAREIVGRDFDRDSVPLQDTNTKSPEFSGDGRKNLGSVIERDTKGRAGEYLGHCPFQLDEIFFGDGFVSRSK